jgi:two-component system LytT family sensor kinase
MIKIKENLNSSEPHFIFWTLFIAYELLVNYYFNGGVLSSWIDIITFYPLNIGLFYLHTSITFFVSRQGKARYFNMLLFIILELLLYLAVKFCIVKLYIFIGAYDVSRNEKLSRFVVSSSWRAGYFIVLSSAFAFGRLTITSLGRISRLDREMLQQRLEKEQTENSLLASKNAFLKAQINPHFLFNILSYIHTRIIIHSEPLGEVIITLSEMMRYAFTETGQDGKVVLKDEIQQMENYIGLNQLRYDQQLKIDFVVYGEPGQLRIVPLLFLTLLENVFKYAKLDSPENPAKVHLHIDKQNMSLLILNLKAKKRAAYSNQVGMSNVRKQLEFHYPYRHQLEVEENETSYKLHLNIQL